MAESTVAADTLGGIPLTCILDESTITVAARTYGPGGTYETGMTFANELRMGDIVTLSVETACTPAATDLMPVVEQVSNGDDFVFGVIKSEPRPWGTPPTATSTTIADRLAGKYCRIATVEVWAGITAIRSAHLKMVDAVAVTPGGTTLLDLDVSQCNTDHDFVLNDVAGGVGAGYMSLHYVAKQAASSHTILVGIVGLGTAAT